MLTLQMQCNGTVCRGRQELDSGECDLQQLDDYVSRLPDMLEPAVELLVLWKWGAGGAEMPDQRSESVSSGATSMGWASMGLPIGEVRLLPGAILILTRVLGELSVFFESKP